MSLKFYEISQEFNALSEMLALDGGEITADHEELEKMLTEILTNKLDSLSWYIQKLEGEQEVADNYIKNIQQYKKSRSNAVDRIKSLALEIMEKTGQEKLVGELAQFSIREPIKVAEIESEAQIPVEYTQVKVEIKKKEVLDALKAGIEVPGARLVDGKKSLLMKLKSVK